MQQIQPPVPALCARGGEMAMKEHHVYFLFAFILWILVQTDLLLKDMIPHAKALSTLLAVMGLGKSVAAK
jgi:hypothetical protein